MTFEAATLPFTAPVAILVPADLAHGFRFRAQRYRRLGHELHRGCRRRARRTFGRGACPPASACGRTDCSARRRSRNARACRSCVRTLHDERFLAREGYRLAMRGLLALIAVGVARLAASRARTGSVTLQPEDGTVDALRRLVEDHFRNERQLDFLRRQADMTVDRLNDHVKRATGVTAGHLIRQRVLTEAKRQLVFTSAADPRHRLRSRLLRSVALRAIFPQADRHHAARIPRTARMRHGSPVTLLDWRAAPTGVRWIVAGAEPKRYSYAHAQEAHACPSSGIANRALALGSNPAG